MVCLIIGFKVADCENFRDKLLALPLPLRDGLITAYTDYEEVLVGYSVLNMGEGIEPLCGPIDLNELITRVSLLGDGLAMPHMSSCIAEANTDVFDKYT